MSVCELVCGVCVQVCVSLNGVSVCKRACVCMGCLGVATYGVSVHGLCEG